MARWTHRWLSPCQSDTGLLRFLANSLFSYQQLYLYRAERTVHGGRAMGSSLSLETAPSGNDSPLFRCRPRLLRMGKRECVIILFDYRQGRALASIWKLVAQNYQLLNFRASYFSREAIIYSDFSHIKHDFNYLNKA